MSFAQRGSIDATCDAAGRLCAQARALSFDVAVAPASFDMKTSSGQLYLAIKCLRAADCTFTFPASQQRRKLQSGPPANDACNMFTSCATCLQHNKQCGWCTTPVVYINGVRAPLQRL